MTLSHFLSWTALAVLVFACAGMVLARRWPWRVGWLFLVYPAFALLLAQSWPAFMVVLRLLTGWVVVAVIGTAANSARRRDEADWPFGPDTPLFYLFALAFSVSIGIGATRSLGTLLGAPPQGTIASVVLIGSGVLLTGFNRGHFPFLLGILLAINGIELLYSSAETSSFLLFMVTALNLFAGLAIAHRIVHTYQKEKEQ